MQLKTSASLAICMMYDRGSRLSMGSMHISNPTRRQLKYSVSFVITQRREPIENSTDKEASKIYAKYVPHLEFAGHQVSYGATFNSQLKSKVIESCKRYGPPSGFLTVSFNDIDNPWNIRTCSQTSSNQSFPSGFDKDTGFGNSPTEFMHHM